VIKRLALAAVEYGNGDRNNKAGVRMLAEAVWFVEVYESGGDRQSPLAGVEPGGNRLGRCS